MVQFPYDTLSAGTDADAEVARIARPATYYGDGTFDAPSSESDEDDALLEKPPSPGVAEANIPRSLQSGGGRRRPASLRCLMLCLVGLVALAAGIGALAAASYTGGQAYKPRGTKRVEMDHVMNGTFYAERKSLNWVPEAGDGVYSILAEGHIKLVDLGTNTTKNLLALADVTDEHGAPLSFASWRLSADMRHVLVKADVRKQWRHSSHGNYYVHDLAAKTTRALLPPTYPPATAYAAWAPAGDALAYVHANDLYVVPTPDAPAIRVTAAGNASLFHGVPDWVYEEEVFQSDFALWWAPDAKALAFLRLDETKVPEYAFPVYNPTNNASIFAPYPGETVMKYPKPGYDNPLVSVHIFDVAGFLAANKTAATAAPAAANFTAELTWPGAQAPTDQVIQEVAWVGPATLIIKDVNRAATNGSVVLFDLAGPAVTRATGAVVRALGVQDGGWIDAAQTVFPLPAALAPAGGGAAYLDIVPSSAGFNHLALFWPASARDPLFLTNGSWEVTDRVAAVDTTRALVYFVAAAPSSFERHVYSVPLPSAARPALAGEPVLFTSAADGGPAAGDVGYYSADFSPAGGFALLNYQGPNVPWQRVLSTRNSSAVDYVLTENRLLNQTLRQFELPIVSRYTLENEGFEMNALELRPPRMDDSGRTKYPVLFHVYGGPGSQTASAAFRMDWHVHLASFHQYIVVIVDGRGTGFRGRAFRSVVKNELGTYEIDDQVFAAKTWAGKEYVDDKRIGVWGWSYGGYMAAKTVERGAGVHTLGMSVAPVTSWALYDSIYTERYMDTPQANPKGYAQSAVHNMTAFHNTPYALAHGSGDDNVHYAHSAHMLDMLTQSRARGFRFRMFTDSDHGMGTRGAYREVYEFLEEFVVEKWGAGPKRRGW